MGVIFLNGCSSSGKTSIAAALGGILPVRHVVFGIDNAFPMLPDAMHDHPAGFRFEHDSERRPVLAYGPVGREVLYAHIRIAGAMAAAGVDLVLDEVIVDAAMREAWVTALDGEDVLWVGVHCTADELARRERARGDRRAGQAVAQLNVVHAGMSYDLEVDTTRTSSVDAAGAIAAAYRTRFARSST